MSDITMAPLYEVAECIREHKVSPTELVDACLEKTRKRQDELYAYTTLLANEAKEQARYCEKRIMKDGPKTPLDGIPIALKDLYYTKGILTTAGSQFFKDFYPEYDSTVVKRLADAGSILMGKTNTHEWAFGATSYSWFGQSRNPWNPQKTPGGSSGGSAIAVATGMAYVGMGTDTGGSIRIPSSLCGVVGFKPTYGLTSQYGVVALSYTLDHIGPLCRSVKDCAIVMDHITGYDPLDPCPAAWKGGPTNFASQLLDDESFQRKVIGVPTGYFFDRLDYEVEKLLNCQLDMLKDAGAEVRYIDIPSMNDIYDVCTTLMLPDAAHYHKQRFAEHPELFDDLGKEMLTNGNSYSAVQHVDAMRRREVMRRDWEAACDTVDVMVSATTPIPAQDVGCNTVETRGGEYPVAKTIGRFSRAGTTLGFPALSVPMGFTPDGLPVGMMFMSKRGNDLAVLKAGWAHEKISNYTFPA